MSIKSVIELIKQDAGKIFESNQKIVIQKILLANSTFFLDTCFISKNHHIDQEKVIETLSFLNSTSDGIKENVFVVTELMLYELKDSTADVLQEKNKEFFQLMNDRGFTLLLLCEDTICNEISQYMSKTKKEWNVFFCRMMHDNVHLQIGSIIRNDKEIPYYGFCEFNYKVPCDGDFIEKIIAHLKERKRPKDSMAEDLICVSLLFFFELVHDVDNKVFVLCTNDFTAIRRTRQAIKNSYASRLKLFAAINSTTFIQQMVENKIMTSQDEAVEALTKIMGDNVKLLVVEKAPFVTVPDELSIGDSVKKLFEGAPIVFVGRKDL